jgi:hypothetical protein
LILSVRFPIRNQIRVPTTWPISVGNKHYFIESDNGIAVAVGVKFSGLPSEAAPTFEKQQTGPAKVLLSHHGGIYVLEAEHDLRAWQSLLLAYVPIDIDFDNSRQEFSPENDADREKIKVHNFATEKRAIPWRSTEYAILGRAFLGLEKGLPLIELMAIYREALFALFAERSIDAYNGFYLFLETQFCGGKTATHQAVAALMASPEFMSALEDVATAAVTSKRFDSTRFKTLAFWPNDKKALVKEIVELRGRLRHHSLNSPHRWDPNRQEHFDREARFLSQIANNIAFPKTVGTLWEGELVQKFSQLAEEMHMTTKVNVRLTIKTSEQVQDVGLSFSVPQPDTNPELAKFVLEKALEAFDEKSPGAELFSIRATIAGNGRELFRYDIGPTVSR